MPRKDAQRKIIWGSDSVSSIFEGVSLSLRFEVTFDGVLMESGMPAAVEIHFEVKSSSCI
jgi:hypothetical protein